MTAGARCASCLIEGRRAGEARSQVVDNIGRRRSVSLSDGPRSRRAADGGLCIAIGGGCADILIDGRRFREPFDNHRRYNGTVIDLRRSRDPTSRRSLNDGPLSPSVFGLLLQQLKR